MVGARGLSVAVCVAAALLAAAAALRAQQDVTVAPLAIEPRGAHSVLDVITVPLNNSEIFDLPTDVRDVLVGNPEIADVVIKTPRLVFVLGRKIGDTNVFFLDSAGREILRLEVRVELDVAALGKAFLELLPGERIKVTAVNADIVLSGTVRSAQAAEDARLIARRFVKDDENIVNMLRIAGGQQVLLKVRIAEMNRSVGKALGFNTFIAFSNHDFGFSFDSGDRITSGPGFGDFSVDAFALGGISYAIGAFDLLASFIDATESQGLVKTLAEPNLTTVSGENASFVAGGEFPFPSGRDNDGNLVFEFKQFGVVLSFTPVVLSSGVISLKISTEVSSLEPLSTDIELAGAVAFFLATNKAETTVELPSGGSIVIAGLLQNDIRDTVRGFPGLKDIPVLGALFRSVDFAKEETELVIAVTPYLVAPVNIGDIALPTDGFAPASDFDLYFLGRLHDVYARPGEPPPSEPLQGPIGYLME